MNILNIPYFAGGLSHLIPLYVLHHKYLRKNLKIKNQFLVSNKLQNFLEFQGVDCVPVDFFSEESESTLMINDYSEVIKYVIEKEKEAYEKIKPSLVIEDNSFTTPLIAEKHNIPRISIQRTGLFRSIDKRFRNSSHVHSMQKGIHTERSTFLSNQNRLGTPKFSNTDTYFLHKYINPRAKIIPGISTIERLPDDIQKLDSYFYCGPLIVMDKPSKALSDRLDEFLNNNQQKPIVFITTGTIDKTPIEKFIDFFVKRNYAVITTCDSKVNEIYKQEVFYKKLLPLNYVCGITSLVVHQCGSGMYHYPIMNKVPSLTIGTQCYDREDIAQRLQELGVSGHVPHPDDNPDYWNVFLEMVNRFENNTLIDYTMMEKLRNEINDTMANFEIDKAIQYALA